MSTRSKAMVAALAASVLLLSLVGLVTGRNGHHRVLAAPVHPHVAASSPLGTRRAPLLPAAVPLLGKASPASRTVAGANGGRRPNIVLVMMDDMRYDELRFAPQFRRNVLDRGLLFANSFSPYPLCCPARATFLKGQYAHNTGVLYIDNPLAFGAIDDSTTVATRLWDAGYRTALIGKYLNRYGTARSRVTGKPSQRYIPAGWTDWMAAEDPGWHLHGEHGGGAYHYFDQTQNDNGVITFHKGEFADALIAREAMGLAEDYHRSKAPFFLYVAPTAPHNGTPREPDDPKHLVMADGQREVMGTPARPDWVKGRFDSVITKGFGIRAFGSSEADVSDKPAPIRALPDQTAQEKLAERDLERQRAESIYAWDVQFGKLCSELRREGEYDDTVFVVTSDNGYFDGEHRIRDGKIWSHEPSLRVPLIVAGPGIRRGVRYTPASTADLTATVLDLADARPLPAMDGHSLLPAMVGPDQPWTVPVLTEGLLKTIPRTDPDFPPVVTSSGLRTARWKYTRYADGEGELYDLVDDPNELTNLYDDPGHAAVRAELDRIWHRLRECKAARCQVPLPADLQVGPKELARMYHRFVAGVQSYFG